MIAKTNIPNIKDIVNLFVENGVDPNKPDSFNIFPLEHAILINYFELFVALLNLKQINYDQKLQVSYNTTTSVYENGNWKASWGSGNVNQNKTPSGSRNGNQNKHGVLEMEIRMQLYLHIFILLLFFTIQIFLWNSLAEI